MKSCLIGAIWGDACGAPYEGRSHKVYSSGEVHIPSTHAHVTDDTILTLAIARAILEGRPYAETVLEEAQRYPHAGWGRKFKENWVEGNDPTPYGSYANGSAMRVSPIGWAFDSVEDVLREAKASSAITHNHPDAIQAAQAVALAVFLARTGHTKAEIRQDLEERFTYDLSKSLETVRSECHAQGFDSSWASVIPAINVFLETDSLESCIRNAIALAGDADTQASIAGSIAEAFYGPDSKVHVQACALLDGHQQAIFDAFAERFGHICEPPDEDALDEERYVPWLGISTLQPERRFRRRFLLQHLNPPLHEAHISRIKEVLRINTSICPNAKPDGEASDIRVIEIAFTGSHLPSKERLEEIALLEARFLAPDPVIVGFLLIPPEDALVMQLAVPLEGKVAFGKQCRWQGIVGFDPTIYGWDEWEGPQTVTACHQNLFSLLKGKSSGA